MASSPRPRFVPISAFALAALSVQANTHAETTIAWRAIAPGAERASLDVEGVPVALVRFALATYRAQVIVGAGVPPRAQTAAEAARAPGVVAAVNGGFFDEHRAPLGLRIADGRVRAPLRPHADWGVLLLDDARARIVHTTDLRGAVTARGAIQVGPRLVVGGAPLGLKPQRALRTGVALDRDGGHLTLVLADTPVDANARARALPAAGFDAALLLDGGPSTQLALRAGDARDDIPGRLPRARPARHRQGERARGSRTLSPGAPACAAARPDLGRPPNSDRLSLSRPHSRGYGATTPTVWAAIANNKIASGRGRRGREEPPRSTSHGVVLALLIAQTGESLQRTLGGCNEAPSWTGLLVGRLPLAATSVGRCWWASRPRSGRARRTGSSSRRRRSNESTPAPSSKASTRNLDSSLCSRSTTSLSMDQGAGEPGPEFSGVHRHPQEGARRIARRSHRRRDFGHGRGRLSSVEADGCGHPDNGVFVDTARAATDPVCATARLNAGQHFIASASGGTQQQLHGGHRRRLSLPGPGRNATGCGFESHLESVRAALGDETGDPAHGIPVRPVPANNVGFLRDDAFLAVISITNEGECSVPPDSVLFDPDGAVVPTLGPLQTRGLSHTDRCDGHPVLAAVQAGQPARSFRRPASRTTTPSRPGSHARGDPRPLLRRLLQAAKGRPFEGLPVGHHRAAVPLLSIVFDPTRRRRHQVSRKATAAWAPAGSSGRPRRA